MKQRVKRQPTEWKKDLLGICLTKGEHIEYMKNPIHKKQIIKSINKQTEATK